MSVIEMNPGQKAIEEQYEKIKNIPVNPEKSAFEQFGEMETWIFVLGEYRLFLNPLKKHWFLFDRPHNEWKDLDAPAGTVVFSLKGDDLEMTRTNAGIPEPGPATPAGGKERHFCPQCGVPLKPGLKFCSSCGAKII